MSYPMEIKGLLKSALDMALSGQWHGAWLVCEEIAAIARKRLR